MGDSNDGSSGAAQGAQDNQNGGQKDGNKDMVQSSDAQDDAAQPLKSGFFRRIIGALSPTDVGEPPEPVTPTPVQPAAPSMLNLRRLSVEDVMIPKADIISVPSTITKDELVAVFRDSGLTRLPVYQETLDSPIGLAHLKDFALQHGFNGGSKGRFALKKMLRPLLYVPPSMPLGVLLAKMQAERRHLALVIDEYGGVDGLLTIEDLIEQVVGEIEDEHDQAEDRMFTRAKDGAYLALAKTPLDDFEAEIGRSLTTHEDVDEEEIDTLGGLVFMLAGHVPSRGEVIRHPDGTEFEILDADPRRIKRLRVCLTKRTNG
ncbi:hemolysin family protein [Alisedimentitalea sp. MJ-SS2]|uniref:hemolysin family protein n=1 Tax=Aliisedimentitalea sp. MJ-SS2 TaxID=3049795 RepID=UPI00290D28F7|nr:hemolysin family protein [Alisedimentitalea sp. MJ-SS2]MDU8925991.1 hemolysin family protein [Alisedimentitalea sp. MJ-SS2]